MNKLYRGRGVNVNSIQKYEGFLIDLDGTVYHGDRVIPGAIEFVHYLYKNNLPYVFVTNNSSYTVKALLDKLNKMNIIAKEENIFTSSMATAAYIAKQSAGSAQCYVIGESGLYEALKKSELKISEEKCDHVVVGIDRDITYKNLTKAAQFLRDGASLISTNKDIAIPKENGYAIGNGAITAAISISAGVEPVFIGKPERIMMRLALEKLNVNKEKVLMIGDNYKTDILAGVKSDIDTLMVLTGISSEKDLIGATQTERPTYIKDDLSALLHSYAPSLS